MLELTRIACIPNDQQLVNGLIIGNLLIFIAYCLIPIQLFRLARRIKKSGNVVPSHNINKLFKAFIFACGCTHLIGALVFFFPMFHIENMVLWITAIISLFTSYVLFKAVPQMADTVIGFIQLSNKVNKRIDGAP